MNNLKAQKITGVTVSLIAVILVALFVSVSVYADDETICEHQNLTDTQTYWNEQDVTYTPVNNLVHKISGVGRNESYCLDCGERVVHEGIEIDEISQHQFVNGYCKNCGYKLITGWQRIDGSWYFFNTDGSFTIGWKKIKNTWYCFNNVGVMLTGWVKSGSLWYYLKSDGAMATGWLKVGGTWYYLKDDGSMATGWVKSGSLWYYLKSDGAMATGWLKVGGTWYYLKDNGSMATGWVKTGGQWYYLKGNGAMMIGWIKTGGSWYYLKNDGAMATGWIKTGGSWYYLKSSGSMAAREWIRDGDVFYWVNTSGVYTMKTSATTKAQGYSSNTSYLILVDRSMHLVTVYQGSKNHWVLLTGFTCGDGKPSTPTITGEYSIPNKYSSSRPYFDSEGARCWYPTRINGPYLFHSVLYYPASSPSRIMDGTLGAAVSHGCVRLSINNAKWIYDTIPLGTKVVIY